MFQHHVKIFCSPVSTLQLYKSYQQWSIQEKRRPYFSTHKKSSVQPILIDQAQILSSWFLKYQLELVKHKLLILIQ